MGGTRVLVGTRKGAFVLTSDEARTDWKVDGPHFPGMEIYHVKASTLNPDRIYASQSSGWFGQVIHRSDDGGATLGDGRQRLQLRRRPRPAPVVRRLAARLGLHPGLAPRAVAARRRHGLRRRRGRGAVQVHRRRCRVDRAVRPAQARHRPAVAARRRRHVPAHDPPAPERPGPALRRHLRGRRVPHHATAARPGSRSTRVCAPARSPTRTPRSATASTASTCTRRTPTSSTCRSTGTSCAARTAATPGRRSAATCPPTSASRSRCTRTSPRPSTSSRSSATPTTTRPTASCASTAAAPAATSGRR